MDIETGRGLLLKKPEKFLCALARDAKIRLGARFAAGLVFLPQAPAACGAEVLKTLPRIAILSLLGVR
jgi:glutamate synthase (NADPH/NADH) large chain